VRIAQSLVVKYLPERLRKRLTVAKVQFLFRHRATEGRSHRVLV
jgi:hypothetical protein